MVNAGVSPRASAAARRRSSQISNKDELPRSEEGFAPQTDRTIAIQDFR